MSQPKVRTIRGAVAANFIFLHLAMWVIVNGQILIQGILLCMQELLKLQLDVDK